jgi:hypothetical protein
MAFLAINGYEIPVSTKDNPNYSQDIIGEKLGSYSGMIISSIQNYRRRWNIKTTPLTLAEAHSLRNLIAGKGHNWKFDSSVYSSKNLIGTFSRTNGRYLLDGSTVATNTPGYEDGPNVAISPSDESIWIEVGTTPLMSTNTFLDTDGGGGIANGYTAYSNGTGAGTRSIDAVTTTFGRSGCQKIVKNDGGADRFGIRNTSLMTGVSQPNIFQFMIHVDSLSSGASVTIQVDYYTAADAYLETKSTSLSSTTSDFTTVELNPTTNASAAKAYVYVWIQGNDGTIYIQGISSENKNFCTSWTDSTRDDESLAIDATIFNRRDFTLAFWFKPLNAQIVTDRYSSLFECYIDSDNYWQMIIDPGGIPYFAIKGRGSETSTYDSNDTALIRNEWQFLAVHGDNTSFTMILNGVESTKGDTGLGYRVPYGDIVSLYLGSDSNEVSQPGGIYSDLLVLPYRMSTTQILAYYNLNRPFYNLPRLEIYGDYIKRDQDNPIIVEGIFNSMKAIQQSEGLKYILNFDLIEII